jgi:biopolymer transport protein ExbD
VSASNIGGDTDEEEGGVIADINVTPMVDIMLVLLIIFMVTASLIANPSLRVELPKGAPDKVAATSEPDVVVTVLRTGEIQLRQKNLSSNELIDALRAAHNAQPKARLLVLADGKAYHANVVRVMDVARTVGFQRLGIAIQPRTAEQPSPH